MSTIEQMQQRLRELNSQSQIHVYPEAPHGFHAPTRANYDEEASRDGDRRLMEWFTLHGVV